MVVKIGILALQGDVSEHISSFQAAIEKMGANGTVLPVRNRTDLSDCDGLAIPGGESTTLSRLIEGNGLSDAIRDYNGGIFATCAGLVLLGTKIRDSGIRPLGILDVEVERNAFGRQRESFEADIEVKQLNKPFHAVFIRAPVITEAGRGIDILAQVSEGIVGVQQGRHMAFSFHPELTGDLRLHELFLTRLERS